MFGAKPHFYKRLPENLKKPLNAKSVMIFRCADVYFGKETIPAFLENYRKLFSQELGLKVEKLEADKLETDYFEMYLVASKEYSLSNWQTPKRAITFLFQNAGILRRSRSKFRIEERRKIFLKFIAENQQNKIEKDFSVVRIYNERGIALDFRSGLITKENLTFRELRSFVLSGLKLPKGNHLIS